MAKEKVIQFLGEAAKNQGLKDKSLIHVDNFHIH